MRNPKKTNIVLKAAPEDTSKAILLVKMQQLFNTNNELYFYLADCFLSGLLEDEDKT